MAQVIDLSRSTVKTDKPRIRGAANEVHRRTLQALALFAEADSIAYFDQGKNEKYVLKKGKMKITLNVSGNPLDGGFMTIDYGQEKIIQNLLPPTF